jgi:hypothetical protein
VNGDRIGPTTTVAGIFVSPSRAEGTVNFSNFPGCGTAGGPWSANRR